MKDSNFPHLVERIMPSFFSLKRFFLTVLLPSVNKLESIVG